MEEISALLDLEYYKYVELNGPKKFLIHLGEQVDGLVYSQRVLVEGDSNSQESYNEDQIELYTMSEHKEVSGDNKDISLADEIFDDPNEKSHEGIVRNNSQPR